MHMKSPRNPTLARIALAREVSDPRAGFCRSPGRQDAVVETQRCPKIAFVRRVRNSIPISVAREHLPKMFDGLLAREPPLAVIQVHRFGHTRSRFRVVVDLTRPPLLNDSNLPA